MKEINIIVAVSQNKVIGKNGKMPWHYPEDLLWFKRQTFSHAVVMGSNTFKSIGKSLKGRTNYVLSSKNINFDGAKTINSVNQVLNLNHKKIFIIGGSQIYKQFLNYANFIYLTKINKNLAGDTFFDFDKSCFEEFFSQQAKNKDLIFKVYRRIK